MATITVDLRGGPLRPAACPSCGKVVDGAACTYSGTPAEIPERAPDPEPGDVAICNRCGALNRFTADGQLEPQPMEELDEEAREIVRVARESMHVFLPDWAPPGRGR